MEHTRWVCVIHRLALAHVTVSKLIASCKLLLRCHKLGRPLVETITSPITRGSDTALRRLDVGTGTHQQVSVFQTPAPMGDRSQERCCRAKYCELEKPGQGGSPLTGSGQQRSIDPDPQAYARRDRVLVRIRHPLSFQVPRGPSIFHVGQRSRVQGRLCAR